MMFYSVKESVSVLLFGVAEISSWVRVCRSEAREASSRFER